ncbi:MAG: hypothetical protein ACR2FN_10255 [Chitinophagaceae bacterium]
MKKKKEKLVINGTWEDVIKASVKDNPQPKPKNKSNKQSAS